MTEPMPTASMNEAFHHFLLWLDKVQPRRQDVLGDFAGRELCVIHGESLLMHCLAEARVDFQGGLQLLHLVHAVEMFLDKLQTRRCNFNIVWFDDHESLLLPGAVGSSEEVESVPEKRYAWSTAFQKRRLARAVLICHLEQHCRGTTPPVALSFRFPSMDSDAFVAYTKQRPVRLFFASDGQAASICDSMALQRGLGSSPATQRQIGVMTFDSIIYRLAAAGYTVGLLENIAFKSSEIQASLYSAQQGLHFDSVMWRRPAPPGRTALEVDETLLKDYQDLFDRAAKSLGERQFTSRDRTAVVATAMVLNKDACMEMRHRAEALLAHLALLRHCPLSERPRGAYFYPDAEAEIWDRRFMNCFCNASAAILNVSRDSTETWDTYDLVDGRLWASILRTWPSSLLKGRVLDTLDSLRALVCGICRMELNSAGKDASLPTPPMRSNSRASQAPSGQPELLMSFSQPDFEALLKDVHVATAVGGMEPPSAFGSKVFKEDSHWHNTMKVSARPGKGTAQEFQWKLKKQNRRNQQLMAKMVDYAASLTNAIGKVFEPEVIVKTNPEEPSGNVRSRTGKKAIAQKRPAQDRERSHLAEIERQAEMAQMAERSKANTAWSLAFRGFQQEPSLLKRYTLVTKYIAKLPRAHRQVVGPDAILYACTIVGTQLTQNDSGCEAIGPELDALIWQHLQDLRKIPLSSNLYQAATALSADVGFRIDFAAADEKPASAKKEAKRTVQPFLSADAVTALLKGRQRNKSLRSSRGTAFQLINCGPYMEKGFDSQPDTRVSNFDPDAWQRNVLDAIDGRQSLFVVAPTSAGKTFISFYAMKQVLKESDDGVLVYVAPTKALCNQVAADVQARFRKNYATTAGKSIWAINTRDYRINNSMNCQVLVTVPQMLQILLLSPSSSTGSGKNPWTSRIKWIIFDEVHSIGLSEEGVVWEQLLVMAPCPIIALSATVGNPHEFRDWVDRCEREKGRELRMVVHSARYSDLRCYFWTPPASFNLEGVAPTSRWPIPGLGSDGFNHDSPFTAIHPVTALVDRSRDTLDDISLESRDCWTLWQSMNKHQSDNYALDPALDPAVFFTESAVVKSRAVEWEAKLKEALLPWLRNYDSPFLDVQRELSPAKEIKPHEEQYGTARILELLVDLQKRDALPALVFLYDRSGCNESVRQIVSRLGESERQWKATSPEWARTLATFEKHKRDAAHAQKKASKTTKPSKGKQDDDDDGLSSKLDVIREAGSQGRSKWDSFDPDAPLKRFSFANERFSQSELDKYIKDLAWIHLDDDLIEGLRRGVAVHHSGMNRRYLHTVEILFRKGFLRAVVATGTLALGINMPCKTVVFSGDSTYLTALSFRQGAGRAGRRGLDILGNVVFYDFTPQRAKEIMSLRLSDLHGHFPISTSLVLRVATLLHETKRSAFSQMCLQSLFTQTRMYLSGPEGKDAIKHHLRFSIEYLRRHSLLAFNGAPIEFTGLVNHLYYTDSSVFAFHALLEAGYFHSLCAGVHQHEARVLETLVLVLSHLFGRLYCHRYKDADWLASITRHSSKVLLPQLPSEAASILQAHNTGTLFIFRQYVQTYVRQHLAAQPDDTLPFTHHKVLSTGSLGGAASRPVELRSPFSALSGFTDEFQSVRELCSTVRAGVFLEESSVPYIALYPADTDGMPFNAYIYDFFRHGELQTIVKANGIRDSDVWYLLQDFSLVLRVIVTSLANFIDPSSAGADDFAVDDGLSDDQSGAEDEQGGPGPQSMPRATRPAAEEAGGAAKGRAPPRKAKKAEVLDSWLDDESESESEGERVGDVDIGSDTACAPAARSGTTTTIPTTSPGQDLRMVLLAFQKLLDQFDEKFRKVWA